MTMPLVHIVLAIPLCWSVAYSSGAYWRSAHEGAPVQRTNGVPQTSRGTTLKPSRLTSHDLVEVLNYGVVRELNSKAHKREEQLRLRLYAIPREGSCVGGSHYVCSYSYYLAVSSSSAQTRRGSQVVAAYFADHILVGEVVKLNEPYFGGMGIRPRW